MIASMGHVGRFPVPATGVSAPVRTSATPGRSGLVRTDSSRSGSAAGRPGSANLQTITRLVDEDGLATPALTDRDWATYDHTKMHPGRARGDLGTDRGVLRAAQDGGALRDRVSRPT